MTSFYSCFTFVIFYTLVCRKIALVANVICLWKPTLNKVSCILYLVSNPKVKDHCHFTGKYRGAAHKYCNLKLKVKPGKTKTLVLFHNLKGHGSHLIMHKYTLQKETSTTLSTNQKKYISFGIGQLKLLDSFQLIASSLEKLVDVTDKSSFKLTAQEFKKETDYQKWPVYRIISLTTCKLM